MKNETTNNKKDVKKEDMVKFEKEELRRLCNQEYMKSETVFGSNIFRR